MDLKVKIITEADLTGLKATQREIKGVTQAAQEVKAPVQSVTTALDETGKAAGRAAVSKKTLKDAIQAVSKTIPEFGSVVLALKNPWVILAGVIAATIAALRKFMNEVDEMEKAISSFDQLNRAATPFKKIAEENARAAQEQAEAIAKTATATDDAETALGKYITKLEEKAKLDADERAALREREEAGIDADLQGGKISPEQARARRSEVATRFGTADIDAANKLGVNKVQATELARQAAIQAEAAARFALPGARDEAARIEAEVFQKKEGRKSDRVSLDQQEEAARKQIEKLKAQADYFDPNTHSGRVNSRILGTEPGVLSAQAQKQELEERARIEDIKTKRANLDAADASDDSLLKGARGRVSGLEGDQLTASKAIGRLAGLRETTARTVDAETDSARRVAGIQSATRQIQDDSASAAEVEKANEEAREARRKFMDAVIRGKKQEAEDYRAAMERTSTPR